MPLPWLKVGEEVRLVEGGPLHVVEDVNVCAATVRVLHPVPKRVEFGERSFVARKGERFRIAARAAVLREG